MSLEPVGRLLSKWQQKQNDQTGEIQVVGMNYHNNVGLISVITVQMKPVLLEVLQQEPTQQSEIKSLIDWQ